jgi:sialidase-1
MPHLIRFALVALAINSAAAGQSAEPAAPFRLSDELQQRCLETLRQGMRSDEFWPSIHAAEGLSLAGHGQEVIDFLTPLAGRETDDQRRCGLARELVRAGRVGQAQTMVAILQKEDPHGHVHAAESLYKVGRVGDGEALRRAFREAENPALRLMAAAAIAKAGNPAAMKFLRDAVADQKDENASRCYFDHSLAALGEQPSIARLSENLSSPNPAIRTYAATFAGDAGLVQLASKLEKLLDDDHPDARYRAAQSLLFLARQTKAARGDIQVDVFSATKEHPRYTEGSVVELTNGHLLFATTQFVGSGSDFARARIIGRRSADDGRTWSDPVVLQENTGGLNVMSATLRRIRSDDGDRIAFFYLQKNAYDDLHLYVKFSTDEAKSFGESRRVTQEDGYHVVNNDRITQLADGRIIAPAAYTKDVRKVNRFVALCYLSDDGGATWKRSENVVGYANRGAMEPEVIELRDGRLLMILRTQLGHIAASYSSDRGTTWSTAKSFGVRSPEAPATIRRIPATGDLLLIWNDTFTAGAGHGGKRRPLTAAVSSDDGRTWRNRQVLENRPDQTYSYISVAFVGGRLVTTYWVGDDKTGWLSSRFRSFPVARLYDPPAP